MKRELAAIWAEQREQRGVLERLTTLMEGAFGSDGLVKRLGAVEARLIELERRQDERMRALELRVYTVAGSLAVVTPVIVLLARSILK